MSEQEAYHHGMTIREYRHKKHMTRSELAECWPGKNGPGVSVSYVQAVEYGQKHVDDMQTLRKLCDILDIPYWKVGLADYDPFSNEHLPGHGKTMYTETLDVVETLIKQIWSLRTAARIADAEMGVKRLGELFAYFHEQLPPPLRLERRFFLLYIQYLRLKATTHLERKQYKATMSTYQEIFHLVKGQNEPVVLALALKAIGKELDRQGDKQQAVIYLEEARDLSFHGSKLLIAFVQSYLIRAYASSGDKLHFERAVSTGLSLARSINGAIPDGTDFIYSWSPVSSILAEQSWGYNELGEPHKTLAMRDEIIKEVQLGQDARVNAWIPLDWARAYKMINEIEKCIEEARTFYHRSLVMGSSHATSQVHKLITSLERDGYGGVQAVKDFKEELAEGSNCH